MISCYSSTAGNGSAGWLAPGPIAPASPPAQSATPPIPASGSSEAECYKVEQVEGLRRRAHAALATPASTAPAGCMPPNGSAFEAFDSCASSNSSLLCFGLHTISEEESSDCHSTISFSAASGSSSGSTCSSPAAHGGPWSESDWCSAGGSSSSGSSSSCCREALEQVMARVHAATRTLAEIRPAPLDAACAAAAAAHGQLEPLQVGSPSHHKHGPAAQAATALDLWQLAWTGAPGWGDELPASHAGRPYPAAHDQNQRHQFSGHATPPPPLPATLLPAGKEVSAAKAPQPLLKSTGSGRSSSHGSGGAMLAAPRGPAPRGAGLTRRAPAATCWWVLLGTLLGAAAGGGSTMAAYGLLSYISKAALAFGLVWKGALGAAALEGGVVGGAGAGTLRALRVRETRMARELWSVSEESARERATFAELLRQQRARAEHQLECLQELVEQLAAASSHVAVANRGLTASLEVAQLELRLRRESAVTQCSDQAASVALDVGAMRSEQSEMAALVRALHETMVAAQQGGCTAGAAQQACCPAAGAAAGGSDSRALSGLAAPAAASC